MIASATVSRSAAAAVMTAMRSLRNISVFSPLHGRDQNPCSVIIAIHGTKETSARRQMRTRLAPGADPLFPHIMRRNSHRNPARPVISQDTSRRRDLLRYPAGSDRVMCFGFTSTAPASDQLLLAA